ncbi:oxidase [alpha proteobacterium BAL199]|jgi:glycine/D-amino acid oxidase-like deaminating enzyme|nr:oxidase [alpha proteobacterium BAL199]
MSSPTPRIVVVGAGIVGASVAYHLARRGAAVTLVDKGQPAMGVTGQGFAWINVAHSEPGPISGLRRMAVQEYRRLEGELGAAFPINWCGALSWSRDPAKTERFVREHEAHGYDVRLVAREQIALLEPNLLDVPDCAAHAGGEGAIDPVAATEALVRAARKAGAEIRTGTEVTALAMTGGRVAGVATPHGAIDADVVVLAAGTGVRVLGETIGVTLPVDPSPAILLRVATDGRLTNGIIASPDIEIRQVTDHVLLAAEDYIDDTPEDGPAAVAGRAVEAIRQRLRGASGVTLESVGVGWRPMPTDGLPIIGFVDGIGGLYTTVMHAGVTMAAAVGRLSASEILDGTDAAEFASCRLRRFADRPSRP